MNYISALELYKSSDKKIILDCRDVSAIEYGFIPESIFINPADKKHINFIKNNFQNKDCIIIPKNDEQYPQLEKILNIQYLKQGISSWQENDLPLDMFVSIDPYEFELDLKHDKKIVVLDVRNDELYEKKHIDDALNYSLQELYSSPEDELEKKDQIYIYSKLGITSITAVTLLKKAGYQLVKNIAGGMSAMEKFTSMPFELLKSSPN